MSSASPLRGTRVLDGVLSPRPDSDDTCDCVEDVAVRECTLSNADDRQHASTTSDWADSSEDFGERRDARKRGDARHHNLVSERRSFVGGRGRETRT